MSKSKIINELLNSTTISILGMKGTGKSVSSAILINNYKGQAIILDITGVYTMGYLIQDAEYIEVDTTTTRGIVKALKNGFEKHQKIVFELDRLSRSNLVLFCENLFAVINRVGDVAVVIDEVGEVVPQTREFYSQEIERAVRLGRNWGIKPFIMITQRPQKADKNVLALSDYYIIFRLVHNLDLNAVKELIGLSAVEFRSLANQIKKLPVGSAVLLKFDGSYKRIRFDLKSQDIKEDYKSRIHKYLSKVEEVDKKESKKESDEND